MQIKTRETAKKKPVREKRSTLFIIRFLVLWFVSLLLVASVTMLSDINWTRPYLEKELESALNRKAQLGRLKWSLGLNGLSIWTNSLVLREMDDRPFIDCQSSEMGVSVLSIIANKPVINSVSFDSPVVRIAKTGPHSWNIDDLIKPGPEIKLLEVNNGEFDLIDQTNSSNKLDVMTLKSIQVKLNFPHKHAKRPFFLSLVLPRKGYTSTFQIEGLGTGELEQCPDNECSFHASGSRINPRDLEHFLLFVSASGSGGTTKPPVSEEAPGGTATTANSGIATTAKSGNTISGTSMPSGKEEAKVKANAGNGLLSVLKPINGLIDMNATGEGTFTTGMKTRVETTINPLVIQDVKLGEINAGKTKGSLTANLNKDKVVWKDMQLKLKGLEFHSSGELSKWQESNPTVAADLSAHVSDVGALKSLFPSKRPDKNEKAPGPFGFGNFASTRLVGKADIVIKLTGTANDTKVYASMKTKDLAITEMLTRAHIHFPLLFMVGIHPQAKIHSDIHVDHEGRVEINNGKITGPGTDLKATGVLDLKSNKGKLNIHGDRISLKQSGLTLSQNEATYKHVTGYIKLPGRDSFSLDGNAAADATIESTPDNFRLDGSVSLLNASFALKNNQLQVSQMNGNIKVTDTKGGGAVTFDGMRGKMGDGNFELDGRLALTRQPTVNLLIHATSLDMKYLSSLLNLFQINVPVISERQLYGRVEDVVLKVTGTTSNPQIYFTAIPDNLFYRPPGLEKPLRATAGKIVYDHDQLVLNEVSILSRGKTIITSLTIEKVTRECTLRRVKAKTDNIELADIDYYLCSSAMPPPLRQAYADFLKQYQVSKLHGKAYGDILCLINGGDIKFDGIMGCYNAAANAAGYPITSINGIFAASGERLKLQDVTCFIRSSKFTLNGVVNDYRSKRPNWQGDIAATLAPQELVELIPDIAEQTKTKIEVSSKAPLNLHATVEGDFDINKVQYTLLANRNGAIAVKGSFGKIYQPKDTAISIDGFLAIKKSGIDIGDTQLLIGDTLLQLNGEIVKQPPKQTSLTLNFKIPDNAAINKVLAIVYPPLAENISGTIGGSFSVTGDVNNPLVVSDIVLSNVSSPKFGISDLSGTIKGGAVIEKSESKRTIKAVPSVIRIASASVKKLPVKQFKANISLAPPTDKDPRSAIVIEEGEANLAGGTMRFAAKVYPDDNAISTRISLNSISANEIADKLLGHPNEITGSANSEIQISTRGDNYHDLVHNLDGEGSITVKNGVISRIGQLQTRITQYNLLTQGIFGFNLNNLVQSVWPVRSGQFNTLNYAFSFGNGTVKFDEIRFSGDDLRLWGTGQADLEKDKVNLEIAGKIPRIIHSRLGTLGRIAGSLTLQKFMNVVTFHKFENLPSIPLLGELATDKPRAFTFKVDSPANDAKLISRSIEKTFKWIPDKPDASAHPVPGIQHQMSVGSSL